jgi:hypothetical protein
VIPPGNALERKAIKLLFTRPKARILALMPPHTSESTLWLTSVITAK